ncbi:MAG: hypothetical protein NZM04_03860 [Methylacidiphilales bacterium]|nr:hypothetical protein [Candidatus Methylacidiphilales bacterium]MDW8348820.1 hypothetical protein [Verrucomicrobiae bacterium]
MKIKKLIPKSVRLFSSALVLTVLLTSCQPPHKLRPPNHSLSSEQPIDLEEALRFIGEWCTDVTAISRAHAEGKDVLALAEKFLDEKYDYLNGPVLFKPTLGHGENTFRLSRRAALSYFIGGDSLYPDDSGFALKPWREARFEIGKGKQGEVAWRTEGALALIMGNVWFTDEQGNTTKVDKSWVLKRTEDGKLKIYLHMSSLPFTPKD